MALLAPGQLATEETPPRPASDAFPRDPEAAAAALESRGVRVTVVRLPPSVHGHGDHGFVPHVIALAREKGVSPYVGDGSIAGRPCTGSTRPASYRLALEAGAKGGPVPRGR